METSKTLSIADLIGAFAAIDKSAHGNDALINLFLSVVEQGISKQNPQPETVHTQLAAVPTQVGDSSKAGGPHPLIPCEKPAEEIDPVQEKQAKLIRSSFILAGVEDEKIHDVFFAALKLRGGTFSNWTTTAENFAVLLEFLYPQLTYIVRMKLATILGAVL